MGGIDMRRSRPVGKYDTQGNLVDSYTSVTKAAEANGCTANSMWHYCYTGVVSKGFRYAFEGEPVNVYSIDRECPWERNGMFNIDGWAQVCV